MQTERPYALTIAGFDPCSGAGVTADIKTFEQLKVYGLAICTGMTAQTEDEFQSVEWRNKTEVIKELNLLLKKYPVKAVKFGIVPSYEWLTSLITLIKICNQNIHIIVDPIWKTSTGFSLNNTDHTLSEVFLKQVTLFTPNIPEFEFMSKGKNENKFIHEISSYSNLLVKGGHKLENIGTDVLYEKGTITELIPIEANIFPKHGSGCVLSAAITAQLALGDNLKDACIAAKKYTEQFLKSNKSLLGFHAS